MTTRDRIHLMRLEEASMSLAHQAQYVAQLASKAGQIPLAQEAEQVAIGYARRSGAIGALVRKGVSVAGN